MLLFTPYLALYALISLLVVLTIKLILWLKYPCNVKATTNGFFLAFLQLFKRVCHLTIFNLYVKFPEGGFFLF